MRRQVLTEQVKDWLLESILNGAYPPDSRVVETVVAKELGTSQAPVREALRALEVLGIVELVPFRGARVRRLDAQELLEANFVRSAIEIIGARLAMANITDADVDELLAIGDNMHMYAESGNVRALTLEDAKLHERIMQLADNQTLLRVWRSLEPMSRTYITVARVDSDPQQTAALHDPILESIRRRDTDGMVRAIESHFEEIRYWLTRRFNEESEGQATDDLTPSG
ncbi:MAG: GntR family transcriptional regulator [Actinomycetota bacterium]|nr:GntR family transcriptional regulator [Actinomycetota bacterium]